MSPIGLFNKFNEVFGYLAGHAKSFDSLADKRSIRIHMDNGTTYIFTYPANGHYTLVVENVPKIIKEERECNGNNQTEIS